MHLWMNDGCLATGEGTTEKISEFQVGIKPTTSVMPVTKGGIKWNKMVS